MGVGPTAPRRQRGILPLYDRREIGPGNPSWTGPSPSSAARAYLLHHPRMYGGPEGNRTPVSGSTILHSATKPRARCTTYSVVKDQLQTKRATVFRSPPGSFLLFRQSLGADFYLATIMAGTHKMPPGRHGEPGRQWVHALGHCRYASPNSFSPVSWASALACPQNLARGFDRVRKILGHVLSHHTPCCHRVKRIPASLP